jgi:hypothetical protein
MHILLLLSIPLDPAIEVEGSNFLGASLRGAVKRLSQITHLEMTPRLNVSMRM